MWVYQDVDFSKKWLMFYFPPRQSRLKDERLESLNIKID